MRRCPPFFDVVRTARCRAVLR
jgi:Nitroreductase